MPGFRDASYEPRGYQSYTSPASPTALANIPDRARLAMLKVETQPVRWKDDTDLPGATAVSASSGMLLDVGEEFWYTGKLSKLRFIQTTAGAVLHVNYYA